MIQVFTRRRNIDSKVCTSRFDCFNFEFHSRAAATFATISARSCRSPWSKPRPLSGYSGREMLAVRLSHFDPQRTSGRGEAHGSRLSSPSEHRSASGPRFRTLARFSLATMACTVYPAPSGPRLQRLLFQKDNGKAAAAIDAALGRRP